jgi:hypothetical protein
VVRALGLGYARGVKRVLVVAAAALVAYAVLAEDATPAQATPRRTLEPIRHGFEERVGGVGCTTAQVTASIVGRQVIRVQPDDGDSVGVEADVLDVAVGDRRVVWTVGPNADTCALNDSLDGPANWTWSTWRDAMWGLVYHRRVYAIKASLFGGVKSIAGLRVSPRTRRSTPTVKRVKRAFGRPGSLRRGGGYSSASCTARWRRLGLTAVFVNYGARPPCRFGLLQTATIAGPRAGQWAAGIGGRPALTPGTDLAFLESEFIGEDDAFGRRLWTLSEVWVPYGDAGYIPAVSASFSGRGHLLGSDNVRGFELYIGAGGD